MRHLFRLLVVLPIGLVLLLFAIANRHAVTVSFDPFSGGDIAGPALTAPLFIVLLLTGLVGLLVGSFVSWVRQGAWRREARLARADAAAARAETDRLRADALATRVTSDRLAGNQLSGTSLVPVRRDAA